MAINPNTNSIPTYVVNAALMQNMGFYVADRVAPVLSVPRQIDILPIIDEEKEAFRIADIEISNSSSYPSFTIKTSKGGTYNATKKGVEYRESIESIGNDVNTIFRSRGTAIVSNKIRVAKDYLLRALMLATFTSSGVNTDTPSVKWDAANGTPLSDLKKSIDIISQKNNSPNRVLIADTTLRLMSNTTEYKDTIKYVQISNNRPERIAEVVADAIGIDKVEIAVDTKINTAAPGDAANLSSLWRDYAFVYRYETPGVTFNSTFIQPVWNLGGAADMGGINSRFTGNTGEAGEVDGQYFLRQYFIDTLETAVIQGKSYFDFLPVDTSTGFLWTAILA